MSSANGIDTSTSTGTGQISTSIPSSASAANVSAWNCATVFGSSFTARSPPPACVIRSSWARKSNSISKFPSPSGIVPVLRPRGVT